MIKAKMPRVPALPELSRASLETEERIVLLFRDKVVELPELSSFSVSGSLPLTAICQHSPRRITILGGPFDLYKQYHIFLPDGRQFPLHMDGILDRYQTSEPLGCIQHNDYYELRLFAPRARHVKASLYNDPEEEPFEEFYLTFNQNNGVWYGKNDRIKPCILYSYSMTGPDDCDDIRNIQFADPYSYAIVKKNTWLRESLSLVLPSKLLEPAKTPHIAIPPRDLIIYETHVKDQSALSQAVPLNKRGTYTGAVHEGPDTPFNHIAELGVNAIELLPIADYDIFEPTFGDSSLPVHNTWNPYSLNHWGYMPAHFFAPDARYATGFRHKKDLWTGLKGCQVSELRSMVKKFHEKGIAVILDVVFNHVAQYGQNLIRQLDPKYSLRYDIYGYLENKSGCGNDLRTERPMIRRMIIDSLKHWMVVYGVDGFRFDLAGLIDDGTIEELSRELREIYPDVHLIAEPWGGIYDLSRFGKFNWASWNDVFRDGIRGTTEKGGKGFVFGEWSPRDKTNAIVKHISGNLQADSGPFAEESHVVNYVSCHDGYTIGDFIRVSENLWKKPARLKDYLETARMSKELEAILRLSFLILMTSRGAVMFLQGDEWGRAKVIEGKKVKDRRKGQLDPNSYEKDDRTNYLDWSALKYPEAVGLKNYVAGLIELRKCHPALRIARRTDISIIESPSEFAFGYRVSVALDDLVILFNANPDKEITFRLPDGRWTVLADHHQAMAEKGVGGIRQKKMTIPPVAGAVLVHYHGNGH